MVAIAVTIWTLWVLMAGLAVLQTRKLWRRFQREAPTTPPADSPNAWVIVPFKGLDHDLPGALASLCNQTYPHYRLVLVVDSAADPAYPVLQRELAQHPHRTAELLIAGPALPTESQKIHNQIAALTAIESRLRDDEVLVFADSDAVPGPIWLAEMIRDVLNPEHGMITGYRWLIPIHAAHAGGVCLAGHFASIINSSVACIYRQKWTSRAWGGAMALPVATARAGKLRDWLRGALTDDYQFTRMCWSMGKRIWFAPRCLAPTPVDFTWASFWEFARRQYLITRIYMPLTFALGLSVLTFWLIGFLSAGLGLAVALMNPQAGLPWLFPAGALLLVALLNQWRASYRGKVVAAAFTPDIARRLRPTLRYDRWLTPAWMAVHWAIVVSACFGKTIRWRGLAYRLDGPQRIQRLDI